MNTISPAYGIIPARYASHRFPGKPLALILGKPMFWHVYTRACRCKLLSKVVLATDDHRIEAAAKKLNVPVLMTRADHPSGSDRVLEAAVKLQIPAESIVVNIQGDEPALEAKMLSQLLDPFKNFRIQVTTLARPIDAIEAANPDRVKVVFDRNQRALYFSRATIPCHRDRKEGTYHGHMGLYAFRMKTLQKFVALGPGLLEKAEKLEQLRLLEHDIPIHIALTRYHSHGVDRPEDIGFIEQLLKRNSQ